MNEDPTAQELADIAWMSVQEVQRFGLPPQGGVPVAFELRFIQARLGPQDACRTRPVRGGPPEIECDGELHGDAALEEIRNAYMADSTLSGSANLLICPNIDAANILYNVLHHHQRRCDGGPDPDGCGGCGLHPDACRRHRAPRVQHDGPGRGQLRRAPPDSIRL